VIILAAAAGFAIETGSDSFGAQQPHSSTSIDAATSTTSSSTSSTSSTVTTSPTTTNVPVSARIEDPFHSASLAAYLAT